MSSLYATNHSPPHPHRWAPAGRAPTGRPRRAGSAKQGQRDRGSQRPKREWEAEALREDATPVAQEGEETGKTEAEEGIESVEQSVLSVVFFFFCFVFSFCRSFFGGYGEKEIREPRYGDMAKGGKIVTAAAIAFRAACSGIVKYKTSNNTTTARSRTVTRHASSRDGLRLRYVGL